MEDSPSKDLAEDLQSFHISSPAPQRVGNNGMIGRNVMKQYLPNNEFADSKFFSYMGDSESKSYIKRLGEFSMNYGTVQQRTKSPLKKENELPQFKQYLGVNLPEASSKQEVSRDPESELILTASLNDISGIPTNTFKRHDHQNKRHDLKTSKPVSPNMAEEDEEEEDIDPALEARGVFDNILKTQKSNYDFQQAKDGSETETREKYGSEGTSSYLGETPSSLSPNFDAFAEKPAGIKLITPEEMGLVFDNVDGVWYKPPAKNQDISSSRTIDHTDSTVSNISKDQQPNARYLSTSVATKLARPTVVGEKYELEDDTSLDAPQINPQYLLPTNATKNEKNSSNGNTTQNMIGNVTTVSKVETSFQQSKRELISIITEILPARKIDWTRVKNIDLNKRQLHQVIGLSDILPDLMDCNLDSNSLRGLLGVPHGVVTLSCRNNRISTPYLSLDCLLHLETVDLSHNFVGPNLNILSSCLHLREVNLSHNKIRSLSGDMGSSRLLKLDLSHNNISGSIDFALLIKHADSRQRDGRHRHGWSSLEELDLSHNAITRVKNVRCLKNLRVLKIDGNPIKELLEHSGNTKSALKTLTITQTQNSLHRIGTTNANSHAFQDEIPYPRLRILKTDSFRRLSTLRSMPQSLEQLAIQGGHVDALPDWSVYPSSLRKLALVRIQGLREIPPSVAHLVPSLQQLDLSHNELDSCYKLVQALPTLCLTRLAIRDNPLTAAPHKDKRDLAQLLQMACPKLRQLDQ